MAGNALGASQDIPVRSLQALRDADLVIFEEDKIARQTLKAAGIHRDYWRYNEHKQGETLEKLKEVLKSGQTAVYMSDQGMPVAADPGAALLELAYSCNAEVKVIPGPSSIIAAVAACPFIDGPFHFAGFLPREPEQRLKKMKDLDLMRCPVVILDTPYRLVNLLETATQAYSASRKALIALDISGEAEDFIVEPLGKLLDAAKKLEGKLNFVLIVAPR